MAARPWRVPFHTTRYTWPFQATRGVICVPVAIAIGIFIILATLFVAIRYGRHVTRIVHARTDEALLLGLIGTTLLVAGVAQQLDVSAAVGAFLVGEAFMRATEPGQALASLFK